MLLETKMSVISEQYAMHVVLQQLVINSSNMCTWGGLSREAVRQGMPSGPTPRVSVSTCDFPRDLPRAPTGDPDWTERVPTCRAQRPSSSSASIICPASDSACFACHPRSPLPPPHHSLMGSHPWAPLHLPPVYSSLNISSRRRHSHGRVVAAFRNQMVANHPASRPFVS